LLKLLPDGNEFDLLPDGIYNSYIEKNLRFDEAKGMFILENSYRSIIFSTGDCINAFFQKGTVNLVPTESYKPLFPDAAIQRSARSRTTEGSRVVISIKSRSEVLPEYLKKLGILESYITQITALSVLKSASGTYSAAFPGAYIASFDEDLYQLFSVKKEDQDGNTIVYNNEHFESVFQQLGFSGDFYKMSKKEFYSGILEGLKSSNTPFMQYVRKECKIVKEGQDEDNFADTTRLFAETDKVLLSKLKKALILMLGFSGIYMVKTGQLTISSDYKASNPIFDWDQMYQIYRNQMITALSYQEIGRAFYGRSAFVDTLYFSSKDGYYGRFNNFLGAWTTGIKEGIPFKHYIHFIEFIPNNDIQSNINKGDLKLDLSSLSVFQRQRIVRGILDQGLVNYVSMSKEEIDKLTKNQNMEIFFESSKYAAKELIKLIPKKEGLTREDIIKQIGMDMVTLREEHSNRKLEDNKKHRVSTVRHSLEVTKRSWNNPNIVDKEEVTVYVKSNGLGYWVPVDLLIKDADKFKVSTIKIIGRKFKRRVISQGEMDDFIMEKIKTLFKEYEKDKKGLCFADWLIKEKQFYLFYKYIGDYNLRNIDFYSKPS